VELDSVGVLAMLTGAGVVAGVINTIAGGGSFLLLPLLIASGLPPGVANGTIRVGVVVQCVASSVTFQRRGLVDFGVVLRLLAPICGGALFGAWLATRLPDEHLRPVFGAIFMAWAVLLVVRPGRFETPPPEPVTPRFWSFAVAVLIGAYGGFLQAGVGFPLMALLISALGHPAVRANAAKVVLILVYTLLAVPVFVLADQIAWNEGIALAVGSLAGGWLGARWQVRGGARLVRWFVVVAVGISGVLMAFG
jgi:uncharacterized membrane protein YfcA